MIQQKPVDEISLNFSELLIIAKYVKIRFKNREFSCSFLTSGDQKIKNILKLNKRDCFCLYSCLHFYGDCPAKTDLHNKYMI